MSEFKFFKTIEDTIEGIIRFLISLATTIWLYLVRPTSFRRNKLGRTASAHLTAPLTFLAVSAFLAAVGIKFVAIAFFQDLFFLESIGLATSDILDLSAGKLIAIASAPIIIVYLLAIFYSALLRRWAPDDTKFLKDIALYAGAIVLLVVALYSVSTFFVQWRDLDVSSSHLQLSREAECG